MIPLPRPLSFALACLILPLSSWAKEPAPAAAEIPSAIATASTPAPLSKSAARWEKEIAAFEAKDLTEPPPKNGILFIGSSSIRKWTTLKRDFPDLPVYNRGFGGSVISDSVEFIDRIVLPYQPRLIVFYAGGNDLHGQKTPETVASDFQQFAGKVHEHLPKTKIQFISISPNPSRWAEVEQVKAANGLIERFCAANATYLTFLNFFPAMLGSDGQPLPDIFVADKLHMNEKGYRLWTGLLRPHLDATVEK